MFPRGRPPYQIDVETAIDYFIGSDHLYLHEFPESIDGFLLYIDNEPFIAVNSKHSRKRIHWTMTHELVEFVLSRNKPHKPISFSLKNTDFEQEKTVNRITAELLLPEHVIKGAVDILLSSGIAVINEDFINNISEHFNVSERAIIWRLGELGYRDFIKKGVKT